MAPRILVFGVGSIGSVYTYVFTKAIPPANVVAVCRSTYDVVSKNGITINSDVWGQNQKAHPTVVRSIDEAASLSQDMPFDYIVICSKTLPSTPTTPELIKPAVSPTTTIVLIQNGIAIEEPYKKLYPHNTLLSTIAYISATQTAPGVVEHNVTELLHIGTYPASHDTHAAEQLATIVQAGKATAKVHQDVQPERWAKLVVNASWNPICALTRSRDAQFLAWNQSETSAFIRDTMLEIEAVAKACGSQIPEKMIDKLLASSQARELPGVQPSMMADALDGKHMEVEAILGNLVRLAQEHGVKTPIMRTIYMLAGSLDQSFSRARS